MCVCNDVSRQLAVYHEEVSILDAAVRKLEEENLEHMKELHRLNDAQISRYCWLQSWSFKPFEIFSTPGIHLIVK